MTSTEKVRQYVYRLTHADMMKSNLVKTCYSMETGKIIDVKPGWYFFDECFDEYGVYRTEAEAIKACRKYIENIDKESLG